MALKGPDPGAVASFWRKANQSPTRTSCCPRTFRATNQNETFCSPAFNLPEFPLHRGLLCEWARPAQRRAVPALLFPGCLHAPRCQTTSPGECQEQKPREGIGSMARPGTVPLSRQAQTGQSLGARLLGSLGSGGRGAPQLPLLCSRKYAFSE